MRTRLVVALGVFGVVLAGLVSCSSKSAVVTHATTTTVAGPANLRTVLFDQFPSTYVEERVGFDLEGPLDLPGAAKADSGDPTSAQALLQRFSFQRGYQRAWVIKGGPKSLVLLVFLMGSPQQALDYYNEITFADSASTTIKKFPTPVDLASAAGFTLTFTNSSNSDGTQVSQFVDLVRGPLFYHLGIVGPTGSVQPSDILSIAHSQSAEAAALGYS